MGNLIRIVLILFAALLLFVAQVSSEGPGSVRAYNLGGVLIDLAAVIVIVLVACSWRRSRGATPSA